MTAGKSIVLTRWTFVGKVMSLLFNMWLDGHNFSSKEQASFNFVAAITNCILEPPKIKSLTVSIVSPSICDEVVGLDAMILVFWMLSIKPTFSLSSFFFFFLFISPQKSLLFSLYTVSSDHLSEFCYHSFSFFIVSYKLEYAFSSPFFLDSFFFSFSTLFHAIL